MTIITKPISEKKPDKSTEKLVLNEVPVGETVVGSSGEYVQDEEAWFSPSTRRRVSTTTTVCAFIMALIVMSFGIIGGVYLYRQLAGRKMTRFQGWCGIPFEKSSLRILNDRLLGGGPNKPFGMGELRTGWSENSARWFNEEFDLDLESGFHEQIFVPDFGNGRQGRFIHDFQTNKTGIVDMTSRRCFVMPLNRALILPPKNLAEIIQRMKMGYYEFDAQVVQLKMQIVEPPIKNAASQVGDFLARNCHDFPTYNLVPIVDDGIRKRRSTNNELGESFTLAEFAGKNILELSIYEPPKRK